MYGYFYLGKLRYTLRHIIKNEIVKGISLAEGKLNNC